METYIKIDESLKPLLELLKFKIYLNHSDELALDSGNSRFWILDDMQYIFNGSRVTYNGYDINEVTAAIKEEFKHELRKHKLKNLLHNDK